VHHDVVVVDLAVGERVLGVDLEERLDVIEVESGGVILRDVVVIS
jgi:hypothetical protein